MRHLIAGAIAVVAWTHTIEAQTSRPQTPRATAREIVELAADLDSVKADLAIVKGQLAQVLRLLNQRPAQASAASRGTAPPSLTGPVQARIGDAPFLGRADAPVTIVEFSDYQCPFCQRFFATTLQELKQLYVETGKVRYVFRDYPIDQLHPQARKAAEAAHCAGDQGRFWEMHDLLFQNQKSMAVPALAAHADALGLDAAAFAECLSSGRHAPRIERGIADAAAAGVRGTPGFVIGKTTGDSIVVGTAVRGAQPLEAFREIIERTLTQLAQTAP